MSNTPRKSTNLSIDNDLLREAKALNINLSRAAEKGVKIAVQEAKAKQWRSENLDAIKSSNEYVVENGLRLTKFRYF